MSKNKKSRLKFQVGISFYNNTNLMLPDFTHHILCICP